MHTLVIRSLFFNTVYLSSLKNHFDFVEEQLKEEILLI